MKFISILIGKIVLKICELLGKGSAYPGNLAYKINKNILSSFERPKLVIAVTGSSGKGSTTKIISEVFKKSGYKVAYNDKDSNERAAIITTLLKNSTLTGKTKVDVAIFEIDERYVKYVFPYFKPDHVLITNLTKDQPPRQRDYDFILNEIKKGLDPSIKLTLNADDPYMYNFVNQNTNINYYSINKNKYSYKKNKFEVLNISRCPKCNSKLEYNYYHIEHIGSYYCPNCKFKNPKPINTITDIDYTNNIITIDNKYKITTSNNMLFNLYNILQAFTICNQYIKDPYNITKIISNMASIKKIHNEITLNNRKVFILNNKCENAHTYNQSVLFTTRDKNIKTIVISWKEISRRYNFDDISWLYDIEFELLNNVDKIIVCGPQRYDIAVRLKLAKFNTKNIIIKENIMDIKEDIKNSKGNIYAILNFDHVKPFTNLMEELK